MTTGKPEDIPQDVWDEAMRVAVEMEIHAAVGSRTDTKAAVIAIAMVGVVARAILAARTEEREACAQKVANYLAEVVTANDEGRELLSATGLATNETDRRGRLLATISDDLTDAIRKRGEG